MHLLQKITLKMHVVCITELGPLSLSLIIIMVCIFPFYILFSFAVTYFNSYFSLYFFFFFFFSFFLHYF